jgi:hypothetical protein
MPAERPDTVRLPPASGLVSLEEVHAGLRDCAVKARAIDTRRFEELEAPELLRDLVPGTLEAVDQALHLLSRIVDRYENEAPPGLVPEHTPLPSADADFYRDIDALVAEGGSAGGICDLCVLARMELRGKRHQLRGLAATESSWTIISTCASARRKIIKGAAAIDLAIGQHEGRTPVLTGLFETELERSLEVRRAYTRFRRAVAAHATPGPTTVVQAVRAGGVALAVLVGRDIYEDLRVDDRIQLRQLQRQLIGWLQLGPTAPPRAGLKMWHDLFGFSGVLVQINNRTSLREHDRELIASLLPSVRASPSDLLDPTLAKKLRGLGGRDDALDDLLGQSDPRTADVARQLAAVAEALSVPFEGSPLPASNEPVTDGASS